MKILDATRKCVEAFDSRKKELDGVQNQQSMVNQFDRFKIWAGNIGVFAPSTASTDYRLREHSDLRDVILKLLERIQRRISHHDREDLPMPSQGTKDLQSIVESAVPTSPASSTSSLQISESSHSEDEPSGIIPPKSGASVKEELQAVSDIIDRLYRLSSIIRRPLKFTGSAQVAKFSGKDEKAQQESADLESFMRWHLDREFPLEAAHEAYARRSILIDRLVGAVSFRRRRFLYQKRHVRKLQSLGLVSRPEHAAVVTSDIARDVKQPAVDAAGNPMPQKSAADSKNAAIARTGVLSATVASEVPKADARAYASSDSGLTTRSAALRRTKLDVPSLPTALPASKEIICPYCFIPLDRKQTDARGWR